LKTFIITGFIISFLFTLYPLVIYPYQVRRKSRNSKLLCHPGLPHITVIVPVFNEEEFIGNKIENIRESNYPEDKLSIMVVDNDSTDRTGEIAESLGVEVLQSKRGKVFAINEALQRVRTDIVVITDVDIRMDNQAIKTLVQSIGEDIVAASAQIKVEDGHLFYYRSKRAYHDGDWELRYLESLVDSCCSSDGRIMAFDHRVIDKYPEDALVDDFEMSFLVKQKGGRAIFHPAAIGWEQCPVGLRAELEQIARRTAIGLMTAWRYRSFLFNGRYGYFGKLIFPVRRFLIFFIPFFILFQTGAIVYLFKHWGLAALGILSLTMIVTRNIYPAIQFTGILKGYWDLLIGRTRTGGIWERYRDR
jgi:cellulose synthase/poly-beta-1,6-N-acetylglucosamine synthase-like glycosyltransferase